jgi:hypothetical protein
VIIDTAEMTAQKKELEDKINALVTEFEETTGWTIYELEWYKNYSNSQDKLVNVIGISIHKDNIGIG